MPTYKLCNKERESLRKSHIYPEFLYLKLYDNDHKYYVLSTDSEKKTSKKPKGIYEKLLCDDCEGIIGKYEDYAAKFFADSDKETKKYDDATVLKNVEYTPFKLFQMSLLWRTSVTSRKEINSIDLGPHQDKLRKMLLEENPGKSYEYGCMLFDINLEKKIVDQIIFPPEPVKGRVKGHRTYRGIFAGLFWIYVVSSHTDQFPIENAFLTEVGNLPIFNASRKGAEFIFKLGQEFKRAGNFPEVV